MSAYSFVNHRMFVAALSNDSVPSCRVEQRDASPARVAYEAGPASDFRPRQASPPMAGMLLANALLHGYQPTAS